jgi:hypothetical protein
MDEAKKIGNMIGEDILSNFKKNISNMNISEGDRVMFMLDGSTTFGRVEYVMRDGSYAYPGSKFFFEVDENDPAVLIRIWKDGTETNLLTGLPFSQIRIIKE